jgi:membrane-associated phospholipid phosphatase
MSSISDIAEPATAPVGDDAAVDATRLQSLAARWLMFSDYGAAAQRHMAIAWTCILACALASALWLPSSRLSFAASNWIDLLEGLAGCALGGGFIAVASRRLRGDTTRPAVVLRTTLRATELMLRAVLPIGALLAAGGTLSYLITSADLPLQDALLARLDRDLGYDWLRFLDTANSNPVLAGFFVRVYQTISPVAQLAVFWPALNRRGERLAEFIAVLSLSAVGLCVGMWLVPAAGAFAYYRPEPQLISNLSALGEMWSFSHAFSMLRDGSLSVINLSSLQGVVSFPSFHTMLGVMTIYALRDTRWIMIPVLLVNGAMIVSTMPVGGHHLSDVLAGAGLTLGAILLVRRSSGLHARSQHL